jgi:predicted ATPase
MLNSLQLENFKSWQKLDLTIKPITVLFGANSSGKSSIIQFLLLLKQTKDSTNNQAILDFGDLNTPVELGSFKDVVFSHNPELDLKWTLQWDDPKGIIFRDTIHRRSPTFLWSQVALSVDIASSGRQMVTRSMSYNVAQTSFSLTKREGKPGYQLASSNEDVVKFVRTTGRAWDLPEPTKCFSFPDQAQTYFQNAQFLGLLENSYVEQIDRILHLGPLRDDPRRQYPWSGSTPSDVGRRGERTVEAILAATEKGERRNLKYRSPTKSFQEMVAWWLKELRLIDTFRVEEVGKESGLFRVFVRRDRGSAETLITDVGFGVSQIIPFITLLYFAEEGSTILIEQPEIHLHPRVQAGLADLVIAAAKNRKLQLIIESHSEHFLNRLLRRIAEEDTDFGQITKDDVSLYFCNNSDGKSNLVPLEVNLYGSVSNWPRDFFGDQMGDVVARETAAARKRGQSNR